MQKLHFLIIDPQNDFMDRNNVLTTLLDNGVDPVAYGPIFPEPGLPVPGAYEDSEKLAATLARLRNKITGIHVTLDTHQRMDISHALFWQNSKGEHPDVFTLISVEDVENGTWQPINPQWRDRALAYVQSLADNGRYLLCIWPYHCLVGTWGHNVVDVIDAELALWELEHNRRVNFVTKGHNPWTEHYSGVMADVPDSQDPTTQLNVPLLELLQTADMVALTGQALSHCVANTVTDIADNFGEENIKKLWLIQDTTSNVTGFEALGTDFIAKMTARGMNLTTAETFLR